MPTLDAPRSASVAVSFVLETDQAPEFWQFLNGLRGDDLLVELIVNELDARSPHTEVRFEPDRMICAGRGDPVEEEGWARLRKLKGAGHLVKAKVGLFGVKNHGLKACFTLGDEILVRSAGKQILQTLFANGLAAPAYPGVRVPPLEDPEAPAVGTQIEVPYRRRAFEVPHGEALSFPEVTDEFVEGLFREAAETLPKRLLGIIRPGVLNTYTLVLSHHALGRRTFRFECGRFRREASLVSFHRECRELLADGQDTLVAREQAVLSSWSPAGYEKKPQFFQSRSYRVNGKRLFEQDALVIEAAWPVDASGRMKSDVGRLRYPVAYPGDAEGALSGLGVHYSGPFVSDTERHELGAQAKDWNAGLISACDEAFASALKGFLLPRHGAPALQLVAQLRDEARLKQFAERLLKSKAFPTVNAAGAAFPMKKGARLVVPVYLADKAHWAKELAAVVPLGSPIVDPKTPPAFIRLLASGDCAGWTKDHLRFDEGDVLDRLQSFEAEWFPWRSEAEWRRVLTQPDHARAHLDALLPALTAKTPDRASGEMVHLPDGDGRLHPISELKRGVSLPSELIGLDLPPVIHPGLKDHPIFKLEGWRLDAYAFRNMLADGDLNGHSTVVRKRFFDWLAKNPSEVTRDDWPALKALSIWPATDGSLQTFDGLCLPEGKLGSVLGGHIRRPSREVRRLCTHASTSRIRLKLRADPNPEEVAAYYREGLSAFPVDRPLVSAERAQFHAFEAGLASLCHSNRASRALKAIAVEAVALNRESVLRPVAELLRETLETARLCLSSADLLDRSSADLDRVFPTASRPTAQMALTALRCDPGRVDALLPRLRIATESADPALRNELRTLPFIPVDGRLRAPIDLAFKGNQGDFWGEWKTLISAAGLADDAQDLYRSAGVMRSFPDPENSRAFFVWLGMQPPGAVGRNLDCVIRHLAHKNGVGAWRLQPPEVACVPVEAPGGGDLLTIGDAKRFAAVDDFPELADAIRAAMPAFERRLAIHSVKTCSQPVADQLREWGIPTLSSLARGPLGAAGNKPAPAPPGYLEAARGLAAPAAARRFRKQLQELDVHLSLVEPQFQRKLAAIKRVVVADGLTAQFKIARRAFHPRRAWAVLTDEIWLDADGDLDDLLMKALADLVFVQPRPRFLPAILKAALSAGARDYRPLRGDLTIDPEDTETHEDDDDVAEAAHRHPGGEPDPACNQPKPGPIYSGGGGTRKTGGGGGGRKQVVAEDIQRRQLKAEHYAHHCQMELATRAPHELAPVGSYVEFAENRRKIMEAHHPDKVGASGSRHAGNLLILSRLNHERIGTRLSRAEITEALQHAWIPRTIRNADSTIWLDGGVATAVDAVTGEPLPLFFTHTHRAYWLEMAGVALPRGEAAA